jgi:hypothetical protein
MSDLRKIELVLTVISRDSNGPEPADTYFSVGFDDRVDEELSLSQIAREFIRVLRLTSGKL